MVGGVDLMENLLENGPLLGLAGLFGLHVCSTRPFARSAVTRVLTPAVTSLWLRPQV